MSDQEKRRGGLGNGSSLPGFRITSGMFGSVDHERGVKREEVSRLTGGLISNAIKVNLNRLLAPGTYDTILIFSATVPHEAGFAGGAKIFPALPVPT
jgi:hypothetical protein